MGLFDKLKQGLKKTAQLLNTDVRDLFKSQGRLVDEAFLEELLGILIKTDMGVQSAQAIVDEVSVKFRARVVEIDDLLASVKTKL
jgi:fused signal recognition particle receptor